MIKMQSPLVGLLFVILLPVETIHAASEKQVFKNEIIDFSYISSHFNKFQLNRKGIYAGSAFGASRSGFFDDRLAQEQCSCFSQAITKVKENDNTSKSIQLTLGYAVNSFWSLETTLSNIGEYSFDYTGTVPEDTVNQIPAFDINLSEKIQVDGVGISNLLHIPVSSMFSVYGRLGAIRTTVTKSEDFFGSNIEHESTSWEPLLGIGSRLFFGKQSKFSAQVELQRHKVSVDESSKDFSGLSFAAGLFYHFDNHVRIRKTPRVELPHLLVTSHQPEFNGPLIFNIDLTKITHHRLPVSYRLNRQSKDNNRANFSEKLKNTELSLSFNNGLHWQHLSSDAREFVIPPNTLSTQLKIEWTENIAELSDSTIELTLTSQSNLMNNQQVIAFANVKFLPNVSPPNNLNLAQTKATNSLILPPVSLPTTEMRSLKPLTTKVKSASPAFQEKIVVVKTTKPIVGKKKKVIPRVQSMSGNKATPKEKSVSNFLWNDIKSYNTFNQDSPIVLPVLDEIPSDTVFNTRLSQNTMPMYEDAEDNARKTKSSVAVWGNALEYKGNVFLSSHLSLVEEPVVFNIAFKQIKSPEIRIHIPRTRFAFALQEISNVNLYGKKLFAIKNATVFEKNTSKSKIIKNVSAGDSFESLQTLQDWFLVKIDKNNQGWMHASQIAIIPSAVYVRPDAFTYYPVKVGEDPQKTTRPNRALDVLAVESINDNKWFKLKIHNQTGWVNTQYLRPKSALPMTEFLVGLQYYQKQSFHEAIQSINQFIRRVDKQVENNVSLATAFQIKALSHMQLSQWEQANEAISQAIQLTQYDPSVYGLKAVALLGEKLNDQKNISLLDIARQLDFALYLEPEHILARQMVETLKSLVSKNRTNSGSELFIVSKHDEEGLNKLLHQYQFVGLD